MLLPLGVGISPATFGAGKILDMHCRPQIPLPDPRGGDEGDERWSRGEIISFRDIHVLQIWDIGCKPFVGAVENMDIDGLGTFGAGEILDIDRLRSFGARKILDLQVLQERGHEYPCSSQRGTWGSHVAS